MTQEHAPDAVGPAPEPAALPPIVELELTESHEIIARQRMCVVSMIDGGAPYAVPVYYGFDGESIYLGVAEGRKTRALDADPQVYVLITEAGDGDRWRSVAIAGRARSLAEPGERAQGIEVLIAHNRRPERSATAEDRPAPRRRGGRILRIEHAVITGRARR
jgi:nitroimidazol reductase NimA-like FMN-containing flavoprotein (pyridoxamine 5'-phosphate oxidase superfamily)